MLTTDDLFKIIGELHVQLKLAQNHIVRLEQQLAEAKEAKKDREKKESNDKE